MPEKYEFTLLRCHAQQGIIKAITPIYRRFETEEDGGALAASVMEARLKILTDSDGKGSLAVDRLLTFAGRLTPKFMPQDFLRAAEVRPSLVVGASLQRFYPVPESEDEDGESPSDEAPRAHYRFVEDGPAEDQLLFSVLFKDHLRDEYVIRSLFLEESSPAAAVLQYLNENREGDWQPVAGFTSVVGGFWPDADGNPDAAHAKAAPARLPGDPLVRVMSSLLDIALERQGILEAESGGEAGRGVAWLSGKLAERKVVALVVDAPFAEQALLRALQPKVGLMLTTAEPLSPTELALDIKIPSSGSFIVLPMSAYTRLADPDRIIHALSGGEHAVLLSCQSLNVLPESLRNIVELTVTLPRMDRQVFERTFVAVYGVPLQGLEEGGNSWISFAQAKDLARVARDQVDPDEACSVLRTRVEDRLTRITPTHGPSLADLHGLGEAKVRAEMLIADIRAALAGDIPWSQVDRGMLLVGPPGCGKTSLARAIAKDCGVHFLECSAAKWQMAGYLNDHLAAMARDFQDARRFSPSILFIDEMDSVGSREHFTGSNATYSTQVVNALLAELQGFSGREQVVVIGATNNAESIDPALRRAGRLDRVIEVALPTIEALEKIFAYYLKRHGLSVEGVAEIALRPLAEASFGRTGADVSLAVRGALRRARLAGRRVSQDDLFAELYNRPLQDDLTRPLKGEGLRRVAIHEAGHALLRLDCGGALGNITYISIIPRPDGSLGFVSLQPNPDATTLTRADYLSLVAVTLGGRAAEEVFYGADAVGAGAGGSASSDLAKAMGLALDMVCRLGLGSDLKLCWREEPREEDIEQAETLLAESYARAKAVVESKRDIVRRIADALVSRQEMSGHELTKVLEQAGN